jgi:hypothetical protein
MPTHNDSRAVRAWAEYLERYLPEDAERPDRLQLSDPAAMGEQAGRRAIERALSRLIGAASADDRTAGPKAPSPTPASAE